MFNSINPELDIGQAEGGFVMGMGYFMQEQMKFDPVTGQAINDGTWVAILFLFKTLTKKIFAILIFT